MVPHSGMLAFRGADAGRTALNPVDHAAGGGGRIGAVVIVPDDEGVPALLWVDGVARAVGDDEHHLGVAGVQIVIAPADASFARQGLVLKPQTDPLPKFRLNSDVAFGGYMGKCP